MKKLMLSMLFLTIAVAVQAGSEKVCSDKQNSCCCSDMQTSKQTKTQPASSKTASTRSANKTSANRFATKQPLQSPKAFADAR